jgi:nucleotide-binding universal stress UspA family protein
MTGSIIVPLDGSRFGEHALPYALNIAKKTGTPIHLVHVHITPMPVYSTELAVLEGPLDPAMRGRKEDYLDKLASDLRARTTTPVKFALMEGGATESLIDYAGQVKAGMIVMTTHGRGAFGRFWLGSVADRLIRTGPTPIFLVHGSQEQVDLDKEIVLKRVLAPLDGSPFAEQILKPTMDLAGVIGSQCEFFQVFQDVMALDYYPPFLPPEAFEAMPREQLKNDSLQYLERVAAPFRSQGKQIETKVSEAFNPAEGILDQARQSKADWIALATHGRSGLQKLMLGSVADKVIRGATVPVFVYRPLDTK